MTDMPALSALLPIIMLLFLGVAVAIGSQTVRLSPIVGYIALGFAVRASGITIFQSSTIALLAELGVVFLLFDIGLHFSLKRMREEARNIFAFGPLQVLFATLGLGLVALAFGMPVFAAFLVGAILALSSTAVVGRLIAERHQQGCPVALTATAILIFQDVAAIFLLIVAGSLNGEGPVVLMTGFALGKAVLAFGATVLIARFLICPLLHIVAASRNEEVFTAAALLIALAAGWTTGTIGLSLTLGAFLGGVMLSETPYRAVIQSEIRPFRGLLLSFFFISIGHSLDVDILRRFWFVVIGVLVLLVGVKILTNIAASRVFRWSVPGSTQLGFLLSQGSEFAFVILSLPAVQVIVGEPQLSIIIAAVALSMAATPNLAEVGRSLAGHMRQRMQKTVQAEVTPRMLTAPVIIIGMGRVGRTIADALIAFDVSYNGIERDQRRLQEAIADGYNATFGDAGDVRLWESLDLHQRKISILTAPDFDVLSEIGPVVVAKYPALKRFATVSNDIEAERFRAIGITAIVERGVPPGADTAAVVLAELGHGTAEIEEWTQREQERIAEASLEQSIAVRRDHHEASKQYDEADS